MPSMTFSGPASAAPLDSTSGGRSAAVVEYICLFTHDLRRKQKRWEDGRLKYHTFNKRVMVYDERGHFIGDMHWQHDWDFGEGEEVRLERGGVIVQVVECVCQQQQDLSELLAKRAKEKEQRQARVAVRPPQHAPSPITPLTGARVNEHFQTRHRSLNQLLTPTGHHGRAVVPTESPFELRQRSKDSPGDGNDPRPSKRRKCDSTPAPKLGYAQNLFGATLSLSAAPVSSAPPRRAPTQTYRTQPEISPSQEEVRQCASHAETEEDIPEESALRAAFSPADVAVPTRTPQELPRRAMLEDRPSSRATSGYFGRSDREDASLRPSMGAQSSAASHNRRQMISTDNQSPVLRVKPAMVPQTSERLAIGAAGRSILEPNVAETYSEALAAVVTQPGASLSQAIALDGDMDQGPDIRNLVDKRPEEEKIAAGSKRGVPGNPKQSSSKRNRMPQLGGQGSTCPVASTTVATRTEDAAEPPQEERTELRLKPRQRRGLLLLSEKRSKIKQSKQQDVHAIGPSDGTGPIASPIDPMSNTDASPTTRQDHPPDISNSVSRSGSLSPQSSGRQPVQPIDEPECADSMTPCVDVDSGEHNEELADPPESPRAPDSPRARGSTHNNQDNAADGVADSSPSPQARRVRSKRKGPAQARREPSETPSLGSSDGSPVASPEPAMSKPSRQTRKNKSLIDQDSSRTQKKVRRASSTDSDDEELPQAPVRLRLARLSKSVRSREVIGFVPSSPPAANVPSLGHRPLSVGGFDCSGDDAAAVAQREEPPTPKLALSNEPQPFVGKGQAPLPPATLSRAAPSVLQRHKSLPTETAGQQMIKEPGVEQLAATTPSSGSPTGARSLARRTSIGVSQNTITAIHAPGAESIAAPEKEIVPTMGRPLSANKERPPAVDHRTLRSQLHNESLNLSEQPKDPISDTCDMGTRSRVTDGANRHLPDAPTTEAPRPKIANPATRGRKAALRSDAAGQVPQSILPADPPPAPAGMRPSVMPRSGPAASERPKRKMKFPGFSSAKGGGPWSREAHDLLESARPG